MPLMPGDGRSQLARRGQRRRVAADEVVRIEGRLAKDQPEDAVVIGEGDDARAYPTSLWSKVATGKSGDPDVATPTSTDEEN